MVTGSKTSQDIARTGRLSAGKAPRAHPVVTALRLLRLPLDLVLLSLDTLRFSIFYFGRYEYYNKKPCKFCSEKPDGESGQRFCRPAVKYGNQWVFRILCPCARRNAGWPPLCREDDYALSLRNVPQAWAFLLVFWGLTTMPLYWHHAAVPVQAWIQSHRTGPPPASEPIATPPALSDVKAREAEAYRERAAQFMQLLHYVEALQALESAEEILPDDPGIALDISRCHEKLAQYELARDFAQKAYRVDPHNLSVLMQLIGIHVELNQLADAQEFLDAAASLAPESVEVSLARARLAYRNGDRASIDAGLEDALRKAQNNSTNLQAIALTAMETGALDLACRSAGRAVRLDSRNYDAMHTLASALIRRQQIARASQAVNQVVDLDPLGAETDLLKAELKRLRGDWAAALNEYRVIAVKEGLHQAWYWYARILAHSESKEPVDIADRLSTDKIPRNRRLGRALSAYVWLGRNEFKQVLPFAGQFIDDYPWAPDGYVLRAKAEYQQRRYAEAAEAAGQALRRSTLHFEARLLRADALSRSGNLDGARQHLDTLQLDYPEHVEPLLVLAEIELRENRPATALKHLDRSGAIAPGRSAVAYHTGRILLEMNRREDDERVHDLANALMLNVDPLTTLDANEIPVLKPVPAYAGYELLARLFYLKKKPERTLEMAQRVAEISPESPTGHYLAALALRDLNQNREARSACLRSLRLDEHYVEARELLAKLPPDAP